MSNPIRIEVSRGSSLESLHFASLQVAQQSGEILDVWGDAKQMFFPRSALKPFQALPFVEANFDWVGDKEIALACSSHNGEQKHIELAHKILQQKNFSMTDLRCGPSAPLLESLREDFYRSNQEKTSLVHNCSGKHTAMLCAAKDKPLEYFHYDHSLQIQIRDQVSELLQYDLHQAEWGWDGCGIPAYKLPLESMAVAMAQFGQTESQKKILKALRNESYYLAGKSRLVTELIEVTKGRILAKDGAEGVAVLCIPKKSLGIALKVHDGSHRVLEILIAQFLNHYKLLESEEKLQLQTYIDGCIFNSTNQIVGHIQSYF